MEFAKHEVTDRAYKDTYWQPYHWLLTKEKEKERENFETLLQAFTKTFSWISFSCISYKTSTDHTKIDIGLYLPDKISFGSTKQKKKNKKCTLFGFILT